MPGLALAHTTEVASICESDTQAAQASACSH
jgi:hypothetical protein